MVDFGNCKKFLDDKNKHIEFGNDKNPFPSDIKFKSVHGHIRKSKNICYWRSLQKRWYRVLGLHAGVLAEGDLAMERSAGGIDRDPRDIDQRKEDQHPHQHTLWGTGQIVYPVLRVCPFTGVWGGTRLRVVEKTLQGLVWSFRVPQQQGIGLGRKTPILIPFIWLLINNSWPGNSGQSWQITPQTSS